MSTPFLGEVKLVSFNFAPKGWALCNGQLLQVAQNQALYALLGNTYGGTGPQTFALPNLQGRTPIYKSASITQGSMGGEENHLLTIGEMPSHYHTVMASTTQADNNNPAGNVLAANTTNVYATGGSTVTLPSGTIGTIGGQAHNNLQPYLVLNFVIALTGIYPSRN